MEWPATRASFLGELSAGLSWERFYDQYSGVIRNFVRLRGLDDHSADDVVQETVMALVRALPKFQYRPERGRFRAWLKTIVRHKTEEARRRRRDGKDISGDAPTEDGTTLFDRLAAEEPTEIADASERAWRTAIYEEAWRRIRADSRVKPQNVEIFFALLKRTPVETISRQTGLEPNAIYQVKNRLTARLERERKAIEAFTVSTPNRPARSSS